jgi:MFS family permease
MAYGFSVFWLPMSKCSPARRLLAGFLAELTANCNWTVADVTHIFETFIAMLGISAAIWGGWLERAGPRKAGLIAALCWGGGLILGGYGVMIHQLWLVFLGCGFIGGIGQGLGYITPVSTLIKWFPDRRGMATGFAIMGYGGGAMIGSPLAVWLMAHFAKNGMSGVCDDADGDGRDLFPRDDARRLRLPCRARSAGVRRLDAPAADAGNA